MVSEGMLPVASGRMSATTIRRLCPFLSVTSVAVSASPTVADVASTVVPLIRRTLVTWVEPASALASMVSWSSVSALPPPSVTTSTPKMSWSLAPRQVLVRPVMAVVLTYSMSLGLTLDTVMSQPVMSVVPRVVHPKATMPLSVVEVKV